MQITILYEYSLSGLLFKCILLMAFNIELMVQSVQKSIVLLKQRALKGK